MTEGRVWLVQCLRDESLREERAMADWLKDNLAPTISQFLARAEANSAKR